MIYSVVDTWGNFLILITQEGVHLKDWMCLKESVYSHNCKNTPQNNFISQ